VPQANDLRLWAFEVAPTLYTNGLLLLIDFGILGAKEHRPGGSMDLDLNKKRAPTLDLAFLV